MGGHQDGIAQALCSQAPVGVVVDVAPRSTPVRLVLQVRAENIPAVLVPSKRFNADDPLRSRLSYLHRSHAESISKIQGIALIHAYSRQVWMEILDALSLYLAWQLARCRS